MSRQHKSGGARFIPAINKSERGASCDKVWGESTENWNPDKVLLLLLEELLKKIKMGKVKRAPAAINELGVKPKHKVYEWNSCCWPAVSAAMSLRQTAALLAAALPSCDGRREVVTHLHPFVGAAVRVGLVPQVQIQHTHTHTHTLAPQQGTIHHQLNCCSAGVTASGEGGGGDGSRHWRFHATRGIVKKKEKKL